MEIAPDIKTKLERAIHQLLAAGWNTRQVSDALSKQQSFGKYEGCTPTAINTLAVSICRASNAKHARTGRAIEAILKAARM